MEERGGGEAAREEEGGGGPDFFSWLSTELLLHFLSFFEFRELVAISASCKTLQAAGGLIVRNILHHSELHGFIFHWNNTGDSELLWKPLFHKHFRIVRFTIDNFKKIKIDWRLRV